jgi:hypothetical protein
MLSKILIFFNKCASYHPESGESLRMLIDFNFFSKITEKSLHLGYSYVKKLSTDHHERKFGIALRNNSFPTFGITLISDPYQSQVVLSS